MPWNWVWVGGAFLVGFYAGVMLMSLLAIAKQEGRDCARGAMSNPARMLRAPLRHRRPA
jgi:hypothetical protein